MPLPEARRPSGCARHSAATSTRSAASLFAPSRRPATPPSTPSPTTCGAGSTACPYGHARARFGTSPAASPVATAGASPPPPRILSVLVGVSGVVGIQNRRIAAERDRAERERDKAQSVAGVLEDRLLGIDPGGRGRSGATTVRALLDPGAVRVQTVADPAARAHLLDVMGRVYRAFADYDHALPLHQAAARLSAATHGPLARETLSPTITSPTCSTRWAAATTPSASTAALSPPGARAATPTASSRARPISRRRSSTPGARRGAASRARGPRRRRRAPRRRSAGPRGPLSRAAFLLLLGRPIRSKTPSPSPSTSCAAPCDLRARDGAGAHLHRRRRDPPWRSRSQQRPARRGHRLLRRRRGHAGARVGPRPPVDALRALLTSATPLPAPEHRPAAALPRVRTTPKPRRTRARAADHAAEARATAGPAGFVAPGAACASRRTQSRFFRG